MSKPFNKLGSSLEEMLSIKNILSFNTYNNEIDVVISIPDTDNTLTAKDLAIDFNEEAYMSTDEFGNKQYFINWVTLKALNSTKVALSWLNRGDYVIANNKTGIDLGLYMYGPLGNSNADFYYKQTQSNLDPYETFTFSPPIAGRYAVYVCIDRDDDKNSKIDFGVAISQQ